MKKKILFVDDEDLVLMALKSRFRRQRKVWEMVFAEGPEEALEELEEKSFDVVVTDMGMPVMDGVQLLQEVAKRQPNAVRIVLSGDNSERNASRVIQTAHRFLLKPCEPKVLKRVVEEVLELQGLVEDDGIRSIVGNTDLPTMPRTFQRLQRLLSAGTSNAKVIAGVVERDIALSARLLRFVNSGFFGGKSEITSIQHAISYLGLKMVRSLVLSLSIFESFKPGRGPQLSIESLQVHGLLVGRVASNLFKERELSEQAFMIGVLHDIGKLVLATRAPDRLEDVLVNAEEKGLPMFLSEKEVLGTCHAKIGAFLLGQWNLPHAVVDAVARHHVRPDPEQGLDLHSGLYFANLLVHEISPSPDGCSQEMLFINKKELRAQGLLDKLDEWREITKKEAGRV